MKFSYISCSHDAVAYILTSLSVSFWTLTWPRNPKFSHQLRCLHEVIMRHCRVPHISTGAYTMYFNYWLLYTLSTADTEYRIIPTSTLSCSHTVTHFSLLCEHHCTQLSKFPKIQLTPQIESQLLLRLPSNLPTPDQWPPTIHPILIDCGLWIHLQTYLFMLS